MPMITELVDSVVGFSLMSYTRDCKQTNDHECLGQLFKLDHVFIQDM